MGWFSRDLPENPEQAYFRENAGRLAHVADQRAHKADQEAQKHQMGADVYGREGRDYSDPAKARRLAAERDRALDRRDNARAEAKQLRNAAKPTAKKKSSWW